MHLYVLYQLKDLAVHVNPEYQVWMVIENCVTPVIAPI